MQRNPEARSNTRILSVLGLVTILAGLIVMLLLPEIKLAAWGIMALGVVLLVSALILDFRKVSGALTGRRGRFGAGTTLMASIFLGIIIIINGISINFNKRIDTTGLLQFTLTERTKDVLKELNQQVKALCFFVPSKDTIGTTSYAENLLSQYQIYTNYLSVEYIDPDEKPEQAREYGINVETQYQAVVFESLDKRRLVPQTSILTLDDENNITGLEGEHAFTSAILEVTGVAQKKIYFVTGHGEADLSGSYSSVLTGLRDNAYLVENINLMAYPIIPSDTAVLVLASPKSPLTEAEIKAINDYLYAGGQALILADPNFPDGLNDIVNPWGVDLTDGTVVDFGSAVAPRNDMPLVSASRNYFSQTLGVPITSYFPGVIGVKPQEDTEINVLPLVWTSVVSWLERDFKPNEEPVYDEERDDPGSIALGVVLAAAMSEDQPKITRIIVIGDSDFASNEHYAQVNNGDLFLNSINWLAEETKLITIRRSAQPFRRLAVNNDQSNFITYSSLIIPPILVLLIGGIVLWYRRS